MFGFEAADIQDMLIQIGLALLVGLLSGLAPSFMKSSARRSDPSVGAALLFTFLAPLAYGLARYEGLLEGILAMTTSDWVRMGISGLVAALLMLCLYTALTGGLVNKVFPVLYVSIVVMLGVRFFMLGSRPSLWGLCAAVLVLLGTVLILSRSTALFGQLWFLYTLVALAAYCGLQTLQITMGTETPGNLYAFGVSVTACVFLWLFVLIRSKQKTMGGMGLAGWIFPPLAAAAIAGTWLIQYLRSQRGSADVFDCATVAGFVFTILLARIIQKEKLPATAFFGMLLAAAGMVLLQTGI